jgi:hypothetical protein
LQNRGKCIWCGAESLDEFVLPSSVVCANCNNGLAHLDQALTDDFDFLAFFAGVRGRKDRPASVQSRGNVRGTNVDGALSLSVNMNSFSVNAHDGSTVGGFRGRPRDVKVTMKKEGNEVRTSFRMTIGASPKFTRAVFKIGLSVVTFLCGADLVRSRRFDPIRKFVRNGEGLRHVMLCPASETQYVSGKPSVHISEEDEHAVEFRIGPVWFLIDLSENETYMPRYVDLMLRMHGRGGWTILPVDGPLACKAATYVPTFRELFSR